jgi:hypothetical protein
VTLRARKEETKAMATDLALAMAADYLFGDNLPSGAEVHIKKLAELLDDFARLRNETGGSWSVWCEPVPEANGREAGWIDDGERRPHPVWTKVEAEGEAAKWSRINKQWSYEVRRRDRFASSKTELAG